MSEMAIGRREYEQAAGCLYYLTAYGALIAAVGATSLLETIAFCLTALACGRRACRLIERGRDETRVSA